MHRVIQQLLRDSLISNMGTLKAPRSIKVIIIVLLAALICFGIINILWFSYRHYCYDRIVADNTNFEATSDSDRKTFKLSINNDNKFHDVDVVVFYPQYLKTDGNYCFSQRLYLKELSSDTAQYENTYHVSIVVKPSLWSDSVYRVQLTDFTDNQSLYSFEMDNDMNIISYNGKSPESVLNNSEAMESVTATMNVAKEFIN